MDVIYGLFKYSDAVINNDNYNKKQKTGNYLVSGGEVEELPDSNNQLINHLYRMTTKECNVELQKLFGRQVVAKFGKYIERSSKNKLLNLSRKDFKEQELPIIEGFNDLLPFDVSYLNPFNLMLSLYLLAKLFDLAFLLMYLHYIDWKLNSKHYFS